MHMLLKGKRVRVHALGCRTNQYEADAIVSGFLRQGAHLAERDDFDVAVLLTCTVTAMADRKCRQLIRRWRRECPDAIIVAAGCWAQRIPEREAAGLDLDLLVGSRCKSLIIPTVSDLLAGRVTANPLVLREDVLGDSHWDPLHLDAPSLHTRAFLKVQDGCDHFCSYCIIPWVRGKPVSRPLDEVEKETRSVVASGCSEVVLTGVHLGLYGRDLSTGLDELVLRLAEIPGLKRLRFGSLEPFAVDEKLLSALAGCSVFCPHLHLPLQSGDGGILSAMKRGYTPEEFADKVRLIRSYLGDDIHLGSDVLAGFPGETDSAFRNTLDLVRDLGFGRLHVFPFSSREGTPAANLPGQVCRHLAEERCREGIALGQELLDRYARRWVGREVDLLVEEAGGDHITGFSRHYLRVVAEGDAGVGSERKIFVRSAEQGELYSYVYCVSS